MIVIPFFLAFFGIVEFALIMSSVGSHDFATREAARVGSVVGRTDPNVDQYIINAVTSRVQGLVAAKIIEIDVYKADPFNGYCYNASSPPADVTVDDPTCQKDQYYFNGFGPVHTLCTAPGLFCVWPPVNRNDSLANADYLGVRVLYEYTFLTSFVSTLGTILNLSATSVQRIEPQDFQASRVSPLMASRVSVAGELALAATVPVWKQEDEGGIG